MREKILLVTGASSDVGATLVCSIQGNYDKIICHYRNSTAVIEELQSQFGKKIVPVQADFANEKDTIDFAQRIIDERNTPDHFVHLSATPIANKRFAKMQWEDFEKEFQISFRSAVIISSAILPQMVKNKAGKLIFMLSYQTVNQPALKYAAAYTCSKYAILGLMRKLSAEYIDKKITVNGISPSIIETKFLVNIPELLIQKSAENSPLKRNLIADDVVPTFEYLLSPAADCVTGQNIAVTGGN